MASGKSKTGSAKLGSKQLEAMIEEATVDCHDESEQAGGLLVMIEDNLRLPFTTRVLGVEIAVVAVEQDDADDIVAVCERAGERQRMSLSELPLPSPAPEGAEWIAANRHWARHR